MQNAPPLSPTRYLVMHASSLSADKGRSIGEDISMLWCRPIAANCYDFYRSCSLCQQLHFNERSLTPLLMERGLAGSSPRTHQPPLHYRPFGPQTAKLHWPPSSFFLATRTLTCAKRWQVAMHANVTEKVTIKNVTQKSAKIPSVQNTQLKWSLKRQSWR